MTSVSVDWGPWLALAGLGLFHGVNPAMGWLFAVALGLHRHSQHVVLGSLVPIALGHAMAVAIVAAATLMLGLIVEPAGLTRILAMILIAWAAWHALYGHRHRLRVGMQTGFAGLAVWSFFMASAHGAGLMAAPFLLPICSAAAPGQVSGAASAIPLAVAAVSVHTAAMLATIGAIAIIVYKWVDLAFLRRGWINFDMIWIAALLLCGLVLLVA
jgi:hypothetical protein